MGDVLTRRARHQHSGAYQMQTGCRRDGRELSYGETTPAAGPMERCTHRRLFCPIATTAFHKWVQPATKTMHPE
jgi:hypothetical protein